VYGIIEHRRRNTTYATFQTAYSRQRPRELVGYPDDYKMGIFSENLPSCWRSMRFDGILHLVDSRDGLLLFALRQKRFLICNPAMRGSGLPCRH
jgi:hypothetical protein